MAHSQEIVDKVLTLYKTRPDMSTKAIAKVCHVSPSTVVDWAENASIKARPRGRRRAVEPNAKQRRILELAQTHTYMQIGEKMGMTKQGICRIVTTWKDWVKPKKSPFDAGDVILYDGHQYTVKVPGLYFGTVMDSRNRTILNFHWTTKKQTAIKIGHDAKYATSGGNGHVTNGV